MDLSNLLKIPKIVKPQTPKTIRKNQSRHIKLRSSGGLTKLKCIYLTVAVGIVVITSIVMWILIGWILRGTDDDL